jgi:hypothetical protein
VFAGSPRCQYQGHSRLAVRFENHQAPRRTHARTYARMSTHFHTHAHTHPHTSNHSGQYTSKHATDTINRNRGDSKQNKAARQQNSTKQRRRGQGNVPCAEKKRGMRDAGGASCSAGEFRSCAARAGAWVFKSVSPPGTMQMQLAAGVLRNILPQGLFGSLNWRPQNEKQRPWKLQIPFNSIDKLVHAIILSTQLLKLGLW